MVHQWVKRFQFSIDETKIQKIKQYYENEFQVSPVIDLKFRFVKIYCWDTKENSYYWNFLHRAVNKKRCPNRKIKDYLNLFINQGKIPLRVFFSATNWLNPDKIRNYRYDKLRMLSSGIVSLESDENLEISKQIACLLEKYVKEDHLFVYSGNKSIHCYIYNVDPEKWLTASECLNLQKRSPRELINLKTKIFTHYQNLIQVPLDKRTATDPRRVLPLPNSLNAFTMQPVTIIPNNKICEE